MNIYIHLHTHWNTVEKILYLKCTYSFINEDMFIKYIIYLNIDLTLYLVALTTTYLHLK